jgi:hypothetical protein
MFRRESHQNLKGKAILFKRRMMPTAKAAYEIHDDSGSPQLPLLLLFLLMRVASPLHIPGPCFQQLVRLSTTRDLPSSFLSLLARIAQNTER